MNVETGFRGYTSEALRAALVQVIHDATYGAGFLEHRLCSLLARGMVEAMMRGDVETCKIVEGTLLSKLGPEAVAAVSRSVRTMNAPAANTNKNVLLWTRDDDPPNEIARQIRELSR